ncbi:pirin family protein [bacterium]|nr:pirin family protein [bacterium]
MEIITYIRKCAITHRDNMGNEGKTVAGDVQVMSAGTGIFHSEHNLEEVDTLLFQIWIQSAVRNVEPRWETKTFPRHTNDQLIPFVSGRNIHKNEDVLKIYQDAAIFAGRISQGQSFDLHIESNRHIYLVPTMGSIEVNGEKANARDGIHLKDEALLSIKAESDTEIVLADLPIL